MSLNDREEAALAQLAASLANEDPKLAARLGGSSTWRTGRGLFTATVAAVAGLVALPVGATSGIHPISYAGYGLAVYGTIRLIQGGVGRAAVKRFLANLRQDEAADPTPES
jgi:hypothetical protein